MRNIDRRSFLKYCITSATVLGLDASVVARLEAALAKNGEGLPTVIWLACANCTGCTVSLANLIGGGAPTDVGDLLLNTIGLEYHPNLMGAAGDLAVSTLNSAAAVTTSWRWRVGFRPPSGATPACCGPMLPVTT